jgi:hypothetical protein
VHCLDPSDPAASDHSRVGVWVGLIGAGQSAAWLTRDGTEVECSAGVKIKDAAFFAEAKTNGGFRPEWLFDVRAGDKITAVVHYEGLSHGRREFGHLGLGGTGRGLIRWEMYSRTGRRLARNTGIRLAGPTPTSITGRFRVTWQHWR